MNSSNLNSLCSRHFIFHDGIVVFCLSVMKVSSLMFSADNFIFTACNRLSRTWSVESADCSDWMSSLTSFTILVIWDRWDVRLFLTWHTPWQSGWRKMSQIRSNSSWERRLASWVLAPKYDVGKFFLHPLLALSVIPSKHGVHQISPPQQTTPYYPVLPLLRSACDFQHGDLEREYILRPTPTL